MRNAEPKATTDGCGFLMFFFWVLLSCGGVLMPNADARPVYTTLRTLAGMPVLGALVMTTLMPLYLVVFVAEMVWATTLGKTILSLGGWLVPQLDCEATGKWAGYATIREIAQIPLVGGPSAVIALAFYAVYLIIEFCWQFAIAKVLLTCGGWLIPKHENEGEIYTHVRELGQLPVIGGPVAPLALAVNLIIRLLEHIIRLLGHFAMAVGEHIIRLLKHVALAVRDFCVVAWEYQLGKVVFTLGGWLVPNLNQNRVSVLTAVPPPGDVDADLDAPDLVDKVDVKPPQSPAAVAIESVAAERHVSVEKATQVVAQRKNTGHWPDGDPDAAYTCIRKCGKMPLLGGPVVCAALPIWAMFKTLIWLHGTPIGRAILTLGGSLVPVPDEVTRCGHPALVHIAFLSRTPVIGCLGILVFLLYWLAECVQFLFFKRPSIRGAWWVVFGVLRSLNRARHHCLHAIAVAFHRGIARVRNHLATHHIVWKKHAVYDEISFSYPSSWQLDATKPPPHGLACRDPEMLDAKLDNKDSRYPVLLATEAVDRAAAVVVLELYEQSGRWFAPAQSTMLASTTYASNRGTLTFSSGTLSIGRLSDALLRSVEAAHAVDKPDAQVGLIQRYEALQELRKKITALQCISVGDSERKIDGILCEALGPEGVDAARLGDLRRHVEHYVLLLTGLSPVDLLYAKRLRDSGRLRTGQGKSPYGSLLEIIDELCAQTNPDNDRSQREQVWARLTASRVAQSAGRRRFGTAAGDDSIKMPTMPVWDGTTADGVLPVVRAQPVSVTMCVEV